MNYFLDFGYWLNPINDDEMHKFRKEVGNETYFRAFWPHLSAFDQTLYEWHVFGLEYFKA